MTIDETFEDLVARAAGGDELGWQALWAAIEPFLERVVRQPRFLGRLGRLDDDRRNIIVEVMARLRADGFARLARYVAARRDNPDLRFQTWLRVVTKRVGIDYMRRHPDYVDRRHEAGSATAGSWVELEALSANRAAGTDPAALSARGTARQLLAYAADAIAPAHRAALELWAQGAGFDDIAAVVGLRTAADAERAVRAAIERLRRRFRADALAA